MKALVTGGGGFIGRAVIKRLLEAGWKVRSLARGRYLDLLEMGVEARQGDVSDFPAVASAAAGCDAVFHVAGKVGLWGTYPEFRKANVLGTENVVRACRERGVKRLVFTGSPSVVFDGTDIEGVDERAPYPKRFDSLYSRTKAEAERIVLAADSPELSTVSLRPHLVWGPGENHIVSRILAQGRAGVLKRIGDFDKTVDTTYIDDAAEAHLLAAEALSAGKARGKAYFISSGDPRPLWSIVNGMLAAAGLPPVEARVPYRVATGAAWLSEGFYRALGIKEEPRLTRFLVHQLTTAHWFDISAARRDLGYAPKVTIEEGLARLSAWLKAGAAAA